MTLPRCLALDLAGLEGWTGMLERIAQERTGQNSLFPAKPFAAFGAAPSGGPGRAGVFLQTGDKLLNYSKPWKGDVCKPLLVLFWR